MEVLESDWRRLTMQLIGEDNVQRDHAVPKRFKQTGTVIGKAKVETVKRSRIWQIYQDETIEYVGILAKLELSDEEKEQAKEDMGKMLDYIDKLNELDTSGVEPMSHVFPVNNVFREDVVTNGDGHDDTLANAPCAKDDGFKVPKTIGIRRRNDNESDESDSRRAGKKDKSRGSNGKRSRRSSLCTDRKSRGRCA